VILNKLGDDVQNSTFQLQFPHHRKVEKRYMQGDLFLFILKSFKSIGYDESMNPLE
jgi:hypothetical protein